MTDLPTGPQNEQPDEVSFAAPVPPPAADGATGAPSRTHRTARALTWVAVGAVGATVLTGVAFASTRTESSPSAPPSAEAPPAPGPDGVPSGAPGRPGGGHGPGGHGGAFAGLRGLGNVLHGEFVVKQDDGTTKTLLGQRGAVTAASDTSLTVKSSDGFVATWTLSSSTKVRGFRLPADATDPSKATQVTRASDLKVGDNVFVVGTRTNDTAGDATTVGLQPTDAQLKALKDRVGEWRKNGPGMRGGKDGRPAPAPSATASTTA